MNAILKTKDTNLMVNDYVYKGTYCGYEWTEAIEQIISGQTGIPLERVECMDGENVEGAEHYAFFDNEGDSVQIATLIVKP